MRVNDTHTFGVRGQPTHLRPYMLNTHNEKKKTLFHSYLACFVITPTFEYVRVHGIFRVNQAEYVIRILVVASQEYVNIYSSRRHLRHFLT